MMNGFETSAVDLCSFSEPLYWSLPKADTIQYHPPCCYLCVTPFLSVSGGQLEVCPTRLDCNRIAYGTCVRAGLTCCYCSSQCWCTYGKVGSSTQCMKMPPFTLTNQLPGVISTSEVSIAIIMIDQTVCTANPTISQFHA